MYLYVSHNQNWFVLTIFIILFTCRQAEVLKADMTGNKLSSFMTTAVRNLGDLLSASAIALHKLDSLNPADYRT